MIHNYNRTRSVGRLSQTILFLVFICIAFACVANAQKRDNMTEQEDNIIRDEIEIDRKMEIYVRIIDRRLLALTNPNAVEAKQSKKDAASDWGPLRTGTVGELFWDIQKTLDEAIGKIDDAAERDQKNPLFGKTVHTLADACKKWDPQFRSFVDKAPDEKVKGLVLNSIDSCGQVVDASSKVSREVPKEAKDKKKKP